MDSGNSSSMQSSSGGADHQEYDSTTTPLHFHFNTTASPPPLPHHHHQQQHMPPHLLPQPSPANLPADVDHLHPQTPTSALIHPYMMNTNPTNNVLLQQRPFSHNFTTTSSWTITTSPPPTSIEPPGLLDPTYITFHPTPSSSSIEPTTTIPAAIRPPKNPRKRSRASRRAPTTVLTTDTSNFRAMVQEFTGIPSHAPPPSSSSPYSRLLSTSFNTRPPSPPFFPDPFFSFLHAQHQLAPAPAGMLQGSYQQLPFANPPFQPTHHHIPQDIAVDPPPVVDCIIQDRGVNQVITSSSSCGASTDFLAQQGDNTEQGN